jgi:SAM-dependent methyltransferase
MRNKEKWAPSKYVYKKNKLVASRDTEEVGSGSRLIADLVAALYDEYIKVHARGRLIDLGCGKVPLYLAYQNYVSDVLCIDWENTLHKNEFLDIECDLSKELPLNSESIDTIILSDVLEHIPDPEVLWNEMSRILSTGGKLIMNVPFYYWVHESPYDYYRYTEYALRRFAELSGFKVISLKRIGGSPEVFADLFAKHLQFIPLMGNFLANTIQQITHVVVKTHLGKMISEKTGKVIPLGYFLVAEKMPSKGRKM